jgi:uncharacterized protein YrrD
VSDRFGAAQGRKVISRASAKELGNVEHLLVDTEQCRVASVVVGKRRKARLVNWEGVSGFGADAVMIADEESLHEPQNEREQAAVRGQLELLGKRALSDLGNEMGKIDDVIFDPDSGRLESFVVGDQEPPAASLLGAGSFAVILRAAPDADADGGEPAQGSS